MMDTSDMLIIENELAVSLGAVVRRWLEKNGVDGSVSADVEVSYPSCYVDDRGESHSGPLITVNVVLSGDDIEDEDF